MPELQEAVAFDIVDDHWDADKIPDGGKLIGLCRGLIIRDQDDRVRFAHHTVRQHLLRPAVQDGSHIEPFIVESDGLSSPNLMNYYFTDVRAEFQLAVKCAAYLCFSDFESAMVRAGEEKIVTMRQVFKSGGPMAIPATVGLKRYLFQIPYRFLGGNGDIRMPDIDFSSYDRRFNQQAPPELRDKYALLDYVAEYWPWHTKQRLGKTGTEMHVPREVFDEQTFDQFVRGEKLRLEMQIGCLPVFRKFWNLILHKALSFEIRPWGLNQHYGTYGCQGCPPGESKDRPLQRSRWSSLIHWAAEMGHVPLIQALPAEIMDHLYHERYHHQSLNIACAHDQSELISFMFLAIIRNEIVILPPGSTELTLRISQAPYVIADWIEFCCSSGALEGFIALMDFGELFHYKEVAGGALLKGAFAAASSGRLHVVKRLLDNHNVDFRAKDAAKMTLLHVAARNGHADVVEEILRKGNQLSNLQNAQGETPLILASQGGHTKVAQLLLKAGAKVWIQGGKLKSFPLEAKHDDRNGWVRHVGRLRDQDWALSNYEVDRLPAAIHFAVTNGHHDVLLKLLMSDTLVEENTRRGRSPLLLSTLSTNDKETPQLLLDPLECAAVFGQHKCIELLLTTGRRLNRPLKGSSHGSSGSIALHLAVIMGHENIVRLLLQNNADLYSKNEGGVTLLHFAADAGRTAIITLLLGFSSQPDLDNTINRRSELHSQQTPLQLAIEKGHSEAVKKLIKYGADPQMEYWAIGTPINALHLAIKSPKAESAILKAVCVRGIPRSVDGSSDKLSEQNLLALAIVTGSPNKLQTLFDLGLRDSDDMDPERETKDAEAPYLVRQAIEYNEAHCLEVLFANCSYRYDSLKKAAQIARHYRSSRWDDWDDSERYTAERVLQVLGKKLTEMRSVGTSTEDKSHP